ncbi:MAG: zinc-binding dehydrogenase [Lentisphaeria bacterium]|nr:zinc-binding dehydrogenase [Lentisphaeria bacterium]
MGKMKGAVCDGKGGIWIQDVPRPVPGDYECLCRIEACATCTGTDRMSIDGKISWASPDRYPALIGHESVGTVIETGAKVRNIHVGDRFLRPAAWYPGEYREGIFSMMGGYAQYGIVTDTEELLKNDPAAKLNGYMKFQQKLPPESEISAVDGTMLITLKEVYSFVSALGIREGHTVSVMGAGVVAMCMCFFSKLAGARVLVAARREEPLRQCVQAGADVPVCTEKEDLVSALKKAAPRGVDFLLDAAGSAEFLAAATPALADGGAVCAYASGLDEEKLLQKIAPPSAWKFVRQPPGENAVHDHFLSLVRMKVLPFSLFYSHVMPLSSIAEGFQLIRGRKAHKIVFTME